MNRMTNGQITNMRDFTAPYEFREYPKHVTLGQEWRSKNRKSRR